MSLNPDEVRKIAQLSRLALSDASLDEHRRNLSNILDLVAQMDAVDTRDVEPMAHPLNMTQRLRVDEVTESDQRARFQAQAPRVEDGLYLVPRVIE